MSKQKSEHKNSTEQSENTRRRALKSTLLVGGIVGSSTALPSKWTRPIIDNVILPSHAQTTSPDAANLGADQQPDPAPVPTPTVNYFYDDTNTDLVDSALATPRNIAERVLDTVIPSASAVVISRRFYVCMAITGNTYTAKIVVSWYGSWFDEYDGITGTVGTSGSHSLTNQYCSGGSGTPDISLTVSNVTAGSCQCDISQQYEDDVSLNVPVGPCGAANTVCR